MATIEVEVGQLHAQLHEQLEGALGDDYTDGMRQEVEDLIHDSYRELERLQEQESVAQKEVEPSIDDE